jgi:hypothetical protein
LVIECLPNEGIRLFWPKQGRKRPHDPSFENFSRHLIGRYSLFVTFFLTPQEFVCSAVASDAHRMLLRTRTEELLA